jgi:2-polyprenyl-6-methoxyphenol hydroxylase-like FAD-dependent oxidoreductase
MPRRPTQAFALLSGSDTPTSHTQLLDTAVVLGGSIAGLMAARVLADYATTVLVVERDEPETGERRGVPQALQGHALLPGGRTQLERWFPGFTEQLVALGAVFAEPWEHNNYVDGVRGVDAGVTALLSASRPFLEAHIRRRTLALPNVSAVAGRVTGLDFDSGAVTAVRYLTGDTEHHRPAQLVVDAMGRASKLSDWLEQAGWQRPPMRRIVTNVNYATGYFHREPGIATAKAAISRYSPDSTSSVSVAAVNAIEHDQWMILLAGYDEDRPGRDAEEFLRRCKADLPALFGAAVSGARLGEIRTYHQADTRRRDFHLTRLPARLVSVGDAVASFNPVYGQGISSAALHASCLAAYLGSNPELGAPAREFFDLQRVVVDAAWAISATADAARQPEPEPPSARERVQRWLGAELVAAASTDRVVARRFEAVATMLAHPTTLARPHIILRALVVNRLARRRTAPAPAPAAAETTS